MKRRRRPRSVAGIAIVQNPRPGHDELGLDTEPGRRLAVVFTELALAIDSASIERGIVFIPYPQQPTGEVQAVSDTARGSCGSWVRRRGSRA